MINWKIKRFNELSAAEVYEILSLRCEVFIVEQNCPYPDPDGKDVKATHLLGYDSDQLIAYARIFGPGDYFDLTSIGRVLVKEVHRDRKLGHDLMKKAIELSDSNFPRPIKIHAQSYLRKFYESHGFEVHGEEFLEDDIPHLPMFLD
jgi:ElaA protein